MNLGYHYLNMYHNFLIWLHTKYHCQKTTPAISQAANWHSSPQIQKFELMRISHSVSSLNFTTSPINNQFYNLQLRTGFRNNN